MTTRFIMVHLAKAAAANSFDVLTTESREEEGEVVKSEHKQRRKARSPKDWNGERGLIMS